jgi:phenylpyruvate tautomerase PptA (4-oxalocrotonate tautomerase family)
MYPKARSRWNSGGIVKGIHDVINSVEKRPPDGQTCVLINEVLSSHWGNAGTGYVPGT